ncbi:uncharacterized protein LOC144123076 [Amblyomma americanum]
MPKTQHGFEHLKVLSAEPAPLPQDVHQHHPHHADHIAYNFPHPPHVKVHGHHSRPSLVPHHDDGLQKRHAEAEVQTNVFYTAVQERTGLHAIKGLFPTQGTEKPSMKFPLHAWEDDDQDRGVNPFVMAAATLLVLLTLSVVFFLLKSSELVAALEKTTTTEESTGLRPRGLEATHSAFYTLSTNERSSVGTAKTSGAETSIVEPLDALSEVTADGTDTIRGVH